MCLHKPSAAPLVPALQTLTVSRALLALESLLLDINVTALHEVLDRESEREGERVCERVCEREMPCMQYKERHRRGACE